MIIVLRPDGLFGSATGEDAGDRDTALGQLQGEASGFLDRPADEFDDPEGFVFLGVMVAWRLPA
ncbi:hypothetical protein NFI95_08580 [Acetobacteraceae bacterium KSS8]|uniref:Uncharacterized protein n=1 Tax=Endosaccharibacter trunci TaxID=2812733 RepID=A0ABT1W8U0_9PROT|nr:hypothetical protein [Acetobacteraceae bacterium KSS8]